MPQELRPPIFVPIRPPVSGGGYYRIRQINTNGSYTYRRMISLNYTGHNKLLAYSNPAKDQVAIGLDATYIGSKTKLASITGTILKQMEVTEEVTMLDVSRVVLFCITST